MKKFRTFDVTATRHKTNHPDDNDIRFTRRLVWRDRPSILDSVKKYAEDMKRRLYRVAGNGKKLEVKIEEKTS